MTPIPATPAAEPTPAPVAAEQEAPQRTEAAAIPSAGESTTIKPNRKGRTDPGTTVKYAHTVSNGPRRPDVKNVTAVSNQGWPVALLAADGVTPLTDHNGDGIPDTGQMNRRGVEQIVVAVTVPAGAPAGIQDITTVTAISAESTNPRAAATVQDKTTVNRVLSLMIDTPEVSFGEVSADGALDPAIPGLSSVTDADGAYYVRDAALQVEVTSNAPWTGTCLAAENSGTATSVTIAGGRLEWRPAGASAWTSFTTNSISCLPSFPLGTTTFVYDLRLRVEQTDGAGTFTSVVTFDVAS
jgi:hypothetical protein